VKDAKALHKAGETRGVAIVLHPPERLREIGLPAPDCDVHRTLRRAGINALDQPARALGVVPFANVFPPALRAAGLDPRREFLRRGPTLRVTRKVAAHLTVSRDDLADQLGPRDRLLQ